VFFPGFSHFAKNVPVSKHGESFETGSIIKLLPRLAAKNTVTAKNFFSKKGKKRQKRQWLLDVFPRKCYIINISYFFVGGFYMQNLFFLGSKVPPPHLTGSFSRFRFVPAMLVLALALLFSGCNDIQRLFGELYGVDDGPLGSGLAGGGGNAEPGGDDDAGCRRGEKPEHQSQVRH
jgi:hypothetical protein